MKLAVLAVAKTGPPFKGSQGVGPTPSSGSDTVIEGVNSEPPLRLMLKVTELLVLPTMPLVAVTVPPAMVRLAQSALPAPAMKRLVVYVPLLMVRFDRPMLVSPVTATLVP